MTEKVFNKKCNSKKMLRNACVFLTCFENKVDIEIVENVSCVFFLHKRTLIGIIFSEELAGIFFARLEMHLSSERGAGRSQKATIFLQWEFQDPKMDVLYHIRPYFGGISPYITLILPNLFKPLLL